MDFGDGITVLAHHETCTRVFAAPSRPWPFESSGNPYRHREDTGSPQAAQDERAHEQAERHQGGDRVARQAEQVAGSDSAVDERFSGLDSDLPHLELADGLERLADVILLADRDTPGGDQHVGPIGAVEQCGARRLERIGDETEIHHVAAKAFEQSDQRESIRVVDLPRTERLAGQSQLVAAGDDGHSRPTAHLDAIDPHRCGDTHFLRPNAGPGPEHHRSRPDVVPPGTHERPRRKRAGHHHRRAVAPAILLDRDGVRAFRDRCAGEDPRRLARREGRTDVAGRNPLGDPQSRLADVRDVGGPDRVAVHRAVRVTRHVDRCHHVPGDDPTERVHHRDPFAFLDAPGALQQVLASLLHREHGGRRGHGGCPVHTEMVGVPVRGINRSRNLRREVARRAFRRSAARGSSCHRADEIGRERFEAP